MDSGTLATFRCAARALSFTRAAQEMNCAQSSVTARMKNLEEDLGAALFDRTGNRLKLTEAGRRFLEYAERLTALMEEARAAARKAPAPEPVRFAAAESLCVYRLPKVLHAFSLRHPEVRLQFVPLPVREFKRQLLDGGLGAAFVLEAPFGHTALRVDLLRREPMGIFAGAGHRLARARRVTAQDFLGEQVLLTEAGCSYRNQFERALIAAGAHPGAEVEFQSIEAIKRCVELGMGVAPLPEVAVAEEVRQGRLVRLAWAGPPLEVSSHLVWNPGREAPPALRAFLDFCVKALRGRNGGTGRAKA